MYYYKIYTFSRPNWNIRQHSAVITSTPPSMNCSNVKKTLYCQRMNYQSKWYDAHNLEKYHPVFCFIQDRCAVEVFVLKGHDPVCLCLWICKTRVNLSLQGWNAIHRESEICFAGSIIVMVFCIIRFLHDKSLLTF